MSGRVDVVEEILRLTLRISRINFSTSGDILCHHTPIQFKIKQIFVAHSP